MAVSLLQTGKPIVWITKDPTASHRGDTISYTITLQKRWRQGQLGGHDTSHHRLESDAVEL
jgi:hypothetical protein